MIMFLVLSTLNGDHKASVCNNFSSELQWQGRIYWAGVGGTGDISPPFQNPEGIDFISFVIIAIIIIIFSLSVTVVPFLFHHYFAIFTIININIVDSKSDDNADITKSVIVTIIGNDNNFEINTISNKRKKLSQK